MDTIIPPPPDDEDQDGTAMLPVREPGSDDLLLRGLLLFLVGQHVRRDDDTDEHDYVEAAPSGG